MLFLLLKMNSASLQVLECGLHVFRYIHSNGCYGSARVGVSGPKLESNALLGGHWRGYPIPQYHKKIGKYRNTVSKIDEIPIPHLFSVTFT